MNLLMFPTIWGIKAARTFAGEAKLIGEAILAGEAKLIGEATLIGEAILA